MNKQPDFSLKDHQTWKTLYSLQTPLRNQQMVPEFCRGLELLGINEDQIPDINLVNKKLLELSGWQAVYTNGFVPVEDFFQMLSEKKFPVGNFIRDPKDLSYTPAPDVFHDLYGHVPFFTDVDYADFCESFGERALKFKNNPDLMNAFQRLFWFTVEFALLKTQRGRKIFGAGIASSFSECAYALSEKPRIHKFDLHKIRHQDFRIDLIQEDLFILNSVHELYSCLESFEKLLISEEPCKAI